MDIRPSCSFGDNNTNETIVEQGLDFSDLKDKKAFDTI